jgi:hypothetical protein
VRLLQYRQKFFVVVRYELNKSPDGEVNRWLTIKPSHPAIDFDSLK